MMSIEAIPAKKEEDVSTMDLYGPAVVGGTNVKMSQNISGNAT
jgi:hypothetical protein